MWITVGWVEVQHRSSAWQQRSVGTACTETVLASDHVHVLGVTFSSDLSGQARCQCLLIGLPLAAPTTTCQTIPRHMDSAKTLVHAFTASRVDYCNDILAGSPRSMTDKVQCPANAAAHLVTGARKFNHGLARRSALAWRSWTYPIEDWRHSAPLSVDKYLTDCCTPVSRDCQPTPPTLGQSTSSVSTTLPAQYLWPSSLLCCRPDGLELSTGKSPRPSSQQQQLQTTT